MIITKKEQATSNYIFGNDLLLLYALSPSAPNIVPAALYLLFLLLINEYTKHPPKATNTSPKITISTIPISFPPFYYRSRSFMFIPDSAKETNHNNDYRDYGPYIHLHFDFLLIPALYQNTSMEIVHLTVYHRFFSTFLAFS